jgi:hypothetical protein
VLLGQWEEASERIPGLAITCAELLDCSFDTKATRLRDSLSMDRRRRDERGAENPHGRGAWTPGAVTDFTLPRAWAFTLMGIHPHLRRPSGDRPARDVRDELAGRLAAILDEVAEPGWRWAGMKALRWLVELQTSQHGQRGPIGGNGFHRRNGARSHFDRQPAEAQTTGSAGLEAYQPLPTRGGMNRVNALSTCPPMAT